MGAGHRTPSAPAAGELGEAIERLVHGSMKSLRREVGTAGLTMPQFFILRRIQHAGTVPATWWAEQAGLRASTVSGLVDGLVRKGWAIRMRDPADRRRVLVRLSGEGDRLIQRIAEVRRRRMDRAFADLDAGSVSRAASVVSLLAARFERITQSDGVGPAAPRRSPPEGPRSRSSASVSRRGGRRHG